MGQISRIYNYILFLYHYYYYYYYYCFIISNIYLILKIFSYIFIMAINYLKNIFRARVTYF